MKLNQFSLFVTLSMLIVLLSGCEAIEGIFKVGMWTGIIIVVALVAFVFWLINRIRK